MRLSLIVAMDENGLIGADGGLPWRLPADLRDFRRKTLHKPILMGRRTHESIGRALPERDNLVLTRSATFAVPGVRPVASLDAARAAVDGADELVVIGGAQVYALALPAVEHVYLTRVHAAFAGDTWFPALDWAAWEQTRCERFAADEKNPHDYSFIELRRRD